MFTLRLFGGALIEAPDGPLGGPVAQRRQLALLAFLSLQEQRRARRDRLLATLWPEADTDRARHSLADAIYVIRRALGERALTSKGDDVLLDAELLLSDVAAFDAAIARGDLEAAVADYRGPLLDAFHLPGAPDFEHWLDVQRTHYEEVFLRALEDLALRAQAMDAWPEAVQWWRRAAVQQPHNTRVALGLMHAMARAGDRAGAIRQGSVHAVLLKEEFGVEPDPELTALMRELRNGLGVPSSGSSTSEPEGGRLAHVSDPHGDVRPLGDTASVRPGAPAPDPTGTGNGPLAPPSLPFRAPPLVRTRRRRRLQVSIAIIVGVTIMAGVYMARAGAAARELDANRVVVIPFLNRTGDASLNVVGFMAADGITRALLHAGLADVVVPLDGVNASQLAPRAIAAQTGAGTVIWGAFYLHGTSLEFQAQVLDARRGQVEAALAPVVGSRTSPTAAIEQLQHRTLAALSARRQLRPGLNPIRDMGYATPSYAAYHAYWTGMDRFFVYDMDGAAEHLKAAYGLDTAFLAALIFAGVAHLNMGEGAAADSLAGILNARAERLTRAERFQADWLTAKSRGDQSEAYRAAQVLAELLPRSPWKYQAGRDALVMHRPHETLAHLAALDTAQGWVPQWPGYWQVHSGALHVLGRHAEELAVVRQGRNRLGSASALRMLTYEARALAASGHLDELDAVLDVILTLGPTRTASPGGTVRNVALELIAHGHDPHAAAAVFDRAIAWYLARPADEQQRWAVPLAETLYAAGHFEEAEAHFRALASLDPNALAVRGHLGMLAARRGDREAVREIQDWLRAGQDGSPAARRTRLVWRARIAAQMGVPGQLDQITRALELLREAGPGFGAFDAHRDPAFAALRQHRAFRELIRPQG
jgi:DNA-binding SARP family transcriptional activator/tetratricopeptide (TPR) repeat protein